MNTEDFPQRIGLKVDPLTPSSATLTVDDEDVLIGTAGIWIWRPTWPKIDSKVRDEVDAELAMQESVAGLGGVLRLLEGRCVSPADSMQAARWKVSQLAVARSVGLLVPQTLITSDVSAAMSFAASGPTIAKAVAESRVGRVSKQADLRVTVVGRRAFPVRIIVPAHSPVDFRAVDPLQCRYDTSDIDERLTASCVKFLDHFGLRYGAFDFALDNNADPWFLECNPAGQWGWLEELTGLPITAALVDLLLSLR